MRIIPLIAASVLALVPAVAHAQSSLPPAGATEARGHFERGMTLLDAENFDGALAEFQRSFELQPRPNVLYNIGVAQQALHQYPQAAHTLERYLRESENTLTSTRRAEVQRTLDQLRALIARIRVFVAQSGHVIRVDGTNVGTSPIVEPIEVGPGRHTVEVLTNGLAVGREDISTASGETTDVHLTAIPVEQVAPQIRTSPLRVVGVPAGAVLTVDGQATDPSGVAMITPGSHVLHVYAQGYMAWSGNVGVGPGQARTVFVRMPRAATGMTPALFIGGTVATVALAAAGTITGILTQQTHDQYIALFVDDPSAPSVQARGELLRGLTNGFFIGAGVVGVATIIVLTRTQFTTPRAEATIAFTPIAGGAVGAVTIPF